MNNDFNVTHTVAAKNLIRRYYKMRVRITRIRYSETGINSGYHIVFKCSNGEIFSLKSSSDGDARKEYVTSKIDRLVSLGSIQKVKLVKIPPGFDRLGRIGALIHWERSASTLHRLEDKNGILTRILNSKKTAFSVGVAAFMVTALNIGDRHLGNFVYNPRTKGVIIIDCESAFREWSEFGWADELIDAFVNKTPHMKEIHRGIDYAAKIVNSNKRAIIELIRKNIRNANCPLTNNRIETIKEHVLRAY